MVDLIDIDLNPVPSRKRPTTYSDESDVFDAKLPAWTNKANTLAIGANTNAVTAVAAATTATAQAGIATTAAATAAATANFKGKWSALAGALAKPASVGHGDTIYQLLVNLADVTTSEPGSNDTIWLAVNSPFANEIYGAITCAIDMAGLANREIERLRTYFTQQGKVIIYNRGVKSGCVASKSTAREIDIAVGFLFMLGRTYSVPEVLDGTITVPDNDTGAVATCRVYLAVYSGAIVAGITGFGESVGSAGVEVCSLTLPIGNTAATDPDLGSVTLTDTRRVEPDWPMFILAAANKSVSITNIYPDNSYKVGIDIVSAVGGMDQIGEVLAEGRLVNGFTLYTTGTADVVTVRYTTMRLGA